MTDIESQTDNTTDDNQQLIQHQQPGLLVLTGSDPVTVYVNARPHNHPTQAGFSTKRHGGTFFTDGISWTSDDDYAKFITFRFLPGVAKIDCYGLPYSPVVDGTQLLAILATAPASYNFTVRFKNGERHDPEIIVTPPKAEPKP